MLLRPAVLKPASTLIVIMGAVLWLGCGVRGSGLGPQVTEEDGGGGVDGGGRDSGGGGGETSDGAVSDSRDLPSGDGPSTSDSPPDTRDSNVADDVPITADAIPDRPRPDSAPDLMPDSSPSDAHVKRAMLVVGNDPLEPGDEMFHARLGSLGFQVTVALVRNLQTAIAARAAAEKHDLILMSSTVAGNAGHATPFRDVAVPLISCESFTYQELRMTAGDGSFGVENDQTRIVVTNPSHPLAAGISGTAVVNSNPSRFGWGRPLSSAIRIAATFESPDDQTIFAYEVGAKMTAQMTAPARRVGLFMNEPGVSHLNTSGWMLFDAAVTWATGR